MLTCLLSQVRRVKDDQNENRTLAYLRVVSLTAYSTSCPLGASAYNLSENRVFAGVSKLGYRHTGLRWTLIQRQVSFRQKGRRHRRHKDSGDGTSQEMPGTAASHQNLEGRMEQIRPQSLQNGINPTDTWVADFWPPEPWENTFMLSLEHPMCANHPSRELIIALLFLKVLPTSFSVYWCFLAESTIMMVTKWNFLVPSPFLHSLL